MLLVVFHEVHLIHQVYNTCRRGLVPLHSRQGTRYQVRRMTPLFADARCSSTSTLVYSRSFTTNHHEMANCDNQPKITRIRRLACSLTSLRSSVPTRRIQESKHGVRRSNHNILSLCTSPSSLAAKSRREKVSVVSYHRRSGPTSFLRQVTLRQRYTVLLYDIIQTYIRVSYVYHTPIMPSGRSENGETRRISRRRPCYSPSSPENS